MRTGCYHVPMNVTPELIAIVAVGVALLAFLWRLSRDVARLERDLRQEMSDLRQDMRGLERDMQGMGERFSRDLQDVSERFSGDMRELGERVARLEGIVETNNALLRVLVTERHPEVAG